METLTTTGHHCIFGAMQIDKELHRIEFRERLIQAANDAGQNVRGIYAEISRDFSAAGTKVTQQAVKKWFDGDSVPGSDNVRRLAKRFGVSVEWLQYGTGQMKDVMAKTSDGRQVELQIHRVPVLRPDQLDDWRGGGLSFGIDEYVYVDGDLSDDAFAFIISDNSALPYAARSMRGVVEPHDAELKDPVNAEKLIVALDRGAFLIGRYSLRDRATLSPVNPDFRPVELSSGHIIVGALVKLAQHNF
ncbi:MAG: hypothetical protein CL583_01895 [Alteromonadaceae bacterium]|nr:hypothetical protein [Alteromonadaceae bacterium]|tara:strand:+ start:1028 stop:1765 length:738 start_codon:yes stop_codon:yes gene_type:complete